MPDHLQQGIAAFKAGHKSAALRQLHLAIQDDPKDVQAWLWLTGVVDTDQERLECFQAVLRIDPNNENAARGLAQLASKSNVNWQVPAPQATLQPNPVQPVSSIQKKTEEVLFTDKPSSKFMFLSLVLRFSIPFVGALGAVILDKSGIIAPIGTLFLFFIAIALVIFIPVILIFNETTHYTLTNRKLVVEKGVFSRSRKVIPIEKIQDVSSHQLFLQRMVGLGDVVVETAGEKGQMTMRDLGKFREYSEQILALVQKHS